MLKPIQKLEVVDSYISPPIDEREYAKIVFIICNGLIKGLR